MDLVGDTVFMTQQGMRGEDLVEQVLIKYSYWGLLKTKDVVLRKDDIFRSVKNIKPYDKVHEILRHLTATKGIVNGSLLFHNYIIK